MAYGLYIYKDLSSGIRLEIHRKDWTGAATEIRAMGTTPLSLVGLDNRGSDVLTPIIKSTLNIDIKDLGEIDFKELFTSYATRYKVLVFRNGVQVWGGYLTPDSYSQDLEYRTSINLVARDNLGQLDQLDFDYFNEDRDGMVKIADLITKAQEKIEWVMAPIEWYAQQYVASDGISVKDCYINARLFKTDGNEDAKTWWEVLETVLSSLGQQMRYVGNNKVYIINVADLYEVGNINGSTPFDYTIGSAANMEITPSWRQLTVKQDFGLIENAIDYEQDEDYFKYIALEVGPMNRSLYRNKFFKYNTADGTTTGTIDGSWDNGNVSSILQYDGPMFYNNFSFDNAKESGTTYYNTLLFESYRSSANTYAYIPFKVNAANSFIFQASVYRSVFDVDVSDSNGQAIHNLIPIEATSGVTVRFTVRFIGLNGNVLYLHDAGWFSSENIISFSPAGAAGSTETVQVTINILNTPDAGELQICFYPPEWSITGEASGTLRTAMVVMKDLIFHTAAYEDMSKAPGKMEIVGVANEEGNTKESVDITVGEVPSGSGDGLTYAGGLFDASIGHEALTGWHRTDNKGGVLHLSELIGRGFAHHFCAFRNINDEKTGGKVMTGTLPFPETAFFSKHFTIDDEVYIVNAATMDMLAQTAEVELRQVLPYVHQSNIYEANEISGGGSSSIGGGSSKTISWGTPREAVRLYELPAATAEEAKKSYLLIDKDGDETAHKYPASELLKLTDLFFFDEKNQAVGTKYPLYSEKTLSQLGIGNGEGGGGSGGNGTMYHDLLLNLDYPDQHPIAAVTGLQSALDTKLNASDISAWALEPTKPAYSFDEINGLQTALDTKLSLTGGNLTGNLTIDHNQVWHAGNSNLATVNWAASELNIYGNLSGGRVWIGRDHLGAHFGNVDRSENTTSQLRLWNDGRITYWNQASGNTFHDIWHAGNSNLPTVDWSTNNLTVAGSVNVDGNIVVKGTITQLGAAGGDDATDDPFVERPVPGEYWDGKQVYVRSFKGQMSGLGGVVILAYGVDAITDIQASVYTPPYNSVPPGFVYTFNNNAIYDLLYQIYSGDDCLYLSTYGQKIAGAPYVATIRYTKA